jgi:hypothetical protein
VLSENAARCLPDTIVQNEGAVRSLREDIVLCAGAAKTR